MATRFLSDAWVEEARKRVKASKEFHKAIGGQSATLLAEITDAPGGKTVYLYYEFHEGDLVKAETGPKARAAQIHLVGTYETFARLQRGELSLQGAYLQRKVKLTGDAQRAFRFAPAFIAYNQAVQAVATEFP